MKTGLHPMKVKLRLFLDWGITFGKPYEVPEQAERPVHYASKRELIMAIQERSRNSRRPHGNSIKLTNEVI